jgi:hypothetical protein
LLLNLFALDHQEIEGFGVFKKEAVFEHPLIVPSQCIERISLGQECGRRGLQLHARAAAVTDRFLDYPGLELSNNLADILPGLANTSIQRVAYLTPATWAGSHR